MTDYKELKLRASSSPHIRTRQDTRSVMLDVIVALLPDTGDRYLSTPMFTE